MRFYLDDLLGISKIDIGEKMFRKIFNVGKGIEQAGEFMGKDPKMSRRDVFKLGAIAGGTALGLGTLGAGEVRAENIIPPGIKISKEYDINTYRAFIDYKKGRYIEAMKRLNLMDERFNSHTATMIIKPNTPSIDPGYHVVAALVWSNMINNNLTENAGGNAMGKHITMTKNISDKNMKNFGLGISNYMWEWNINKYIKNTYNKRINLQRDIEKPFLSAIFGSAGINTNQHNTLRNQNLNQMGYKSNYPTQETDADKLAQFYMNLPDNRYKKLILDETIENLQKLNKNSKEILIAAWSSFWLTRYAEMTNNCIGFRDEKRDNIKTDAGFYAWNLELDIIKKIGVRIRGPPIY